MYHRHFALREEPFGVSPDDRFFLETEQHREALATLYYGIRQRRGFALLVGGPGLGKTSILVQLLKRLEGEAETAYLPHPYFDKTTVLESILASLGLDASPSLAQNHRIFYEYLMKTRQKGKTCVVVVDEAQNLTRDTLEAIRMLSNFETPSEKLVQFVLSGQPGLAETLRRTECEQIRQRVNVTARLTPFEGSAVREYMEHRLRVAGIPLALTTPSPLFTREALRSIVSASAGVPRNINTICFNCLTLSFALNQRQVGFEEVAEVLRDLDLNLTTAITPEPTVPSTDLRSEIALLQQGSGLPASQLSLRPTVKGRGVSLMAGASLWLRNFFSGV